MRDTDKEKLDREAYERCCDNLFMIINMDDCSQKLILMEMLVEEAILSPFPAVLKLGFIPALCLEIAELKKKIHGNPLRIQKKEDLKQEQFDAEE